jgi:hypothetical protein
VETKTRRIRATSAHDAWQAEAIAACLIELRRELERHFTREVADHLAAHLSP